jgi:hypothetical protein
MMNFTLCWVDKKYNLHGISFTKKIFRIDIGWAKKNFNVKKVFSAIDNDRSPILPVAKRVKLA